MIRKLRVRPARLAVAGRQRRPRRWRRGLPATGGVAATAAAMALGVPAIASAASPPTCDRAVYPRAFLTFESVYSKNTRWIQLREREDMTDPSDQGDPEYPFPVRVDRSKSPSFTRMIHS